MGIGIGIVSEAELKLSNINPQTNILFFVFYNL